ncbi:hypothetical protein Goklo_024144 [Gossypium klotzschianum]|uniref:Uncharacterized protein n=1 Tax=Gossypium klotzschianum TaxID=34286 RepID=A0A7J8WCG9_9ROSI|nr:hypothetical protein [Gossypium klotzschianum]
MQYTELQRKKIRDWNKCWKEKMDMDARNEPSSSRISTTEQNESIKLFARYVGPSNAHPEAEDQISEEREYNNDDKGEEEGNEKDFEEEDD